MDWFKKLFSEPGTLAVLFTSGAVGLVVGIASGLVQRKHGGWSSFFTTLCTGVAVAVIVGLGVKDYIQSETARLALIGAAAVISDDIWAGLRAIGRLLREDPLGTISRILDVFRQGSSKSAAPVMRPLDRGSIDRGPIDRGPIDRGPVSDTERDY